MILAIVQDGPDALIPQQVAEECDGLNLRELVTEASARADREAYEAVHGGCRCGHGHFVGLLLVQRRACFWSGTLRPTARLELIGVRENLWIVEHANDVHHNSGSFLHVHLFNNRRVIGSRDV